MNLIFSLLIILIYISDLTVFSLDAAEAWGMNFQDPATPIMEGIIEFHNHLMFFITLIAVATSWLLARCIYFYNSDTNSRAEMFTHSTSLEIVWTIVPALILLIIAVPSFALLYSMDEMIDPALTLKVVGHQWYWSYEYSDYTTLQGGESLNFDSYMLSTNDLTKGNLRLLEVDNRIILPIKTHIRVIITAADVLHSWAVPSFGIKVDACPGRLNQTSLFIKREGTFYGQCSEICGVNHGFTPIVVRAVNLDQYILWINTKLPNLNIN